MNKFILLLVLCIAFPSFGGEGGATVIGDGGNVLVCKMKPYVRLLDVYEFAPGKSVSLNKDQRHEENVKELIQRLARLPWVTHDDVQQVTRAARTFKHHLFNFRQIEHLGDMIGPFEVHDPEVDSSVRARMIKDRCRLETVTGRFTPPATAIDQFARICSRSSMINGDCFVTVQEMYSRLSSVERSCLVLHESLRFIRSHRLTEIDLRKLTATLCTQK
jgi:hypothetical protein